MKVLPIRAPRTAPSVAHETHIPWSNGMIIRTDAIVLRGLDYGETSRIVTLFTREKGKVSVLAKGARLPKSRFGATLQPMAFTQVVFYYKPTRTLQTLTESAHVQPFHNIGRDLEKITVGLRMMELVNALLQDEEQNPLVFNLLQHALESLDAAPAHAANVWPFFQMRLAAALGFAPDIDRDAVAALPDDGGLLDLATGAVLPFDGVPRAGRRAARTVLRAYAVFARADLDAVLHMTLKPDVRTETERLIEDYLRHHVEDAYPTRSEKVVGQLLRE